MKLTRDSVVDKLLHQAFAVFGSKQELVDRLDEEMENNSNVAAAKRKVETELDQLRDTLDDVQQQLQLVEQEKSQKEKDITTMDAELEKVNDALAKANKEKTSLGDRLQVNRWSVCVCTCQRFEVVLVIATVL